MDIVLDLDDQALQLFMRNFVASFGGNYVVVWTLDQNTRELVCRDGWYNTAMEAGSSSMTGSVGLSLFNLYRLSRFALGIGVPALALDAQTLIWLNSNELLSFCCNDDQRNFYIVAGIQTAMFISCGNGVIELGMTNLILQNEDLKLQISDFVAPFIRLVLSRQTSPSSSLPSRSIDSPESSSYTATTTTTTTTATITEEQLPVTRFPVESMLPFLQPFLPTYQIPSNMPWLQGAPPRPRIIPPQLPRVPPRQPFSQLASRRGAFGAWRAAGMVPPRRMGGSQMRFKRSVELLKHVHAERIRQLEASSAGRSNTPISSSQLHHMISERKRREKLRESFDALRSLLPPGSRKDKASILAKTREYLDTLNSRVQELQTANQRLESLVKENKRTNQESREDVENAPQNAPQTGAFVATAVTVEEEEEEEESVQSDELRLRIRVTNPSNSIDVIIAVLNILRQMEVNMISLTSQTEGGAEAQLIVRIRIRLPQQGTGGDPTRREEIKQGIQRTLERRPQN